MYINIIANQLRGFFFSLFNFVCLALEFSNKLEIKEYTKTIFIKLVAVMKWNDVY